MSEVDKFFSDLPHSEQELGAMNFPAKGDEKDLSQVPDSVKNRRHRRLEAQLNTEREARIAAEARASALEEMNRGQIDSSLNGEIPQEWLTMYGDTEDSRKAYSQFESLQNKQFERFKGNILQEFQSQQEQEKSEQTQYESFIDSQLEALEEAHNVDLTSNTPQAKQARKEYLDLVEKYSPKDEEGHITGYADFNTVWDSYEQSKQQDTYRAKSLSSRSMNPSRGTTPPAADNAAMERYLRDNGIRI